jgi:hypothetical protein
MIEAAALLSALVGKWQDFTIILLLLFANAFIDFWQKPYPSPLLFSATFLTEIVGTLLTVYGVFFGSHRLEICSADPGLCPGRIRFERHGQDRYLPLSAKISQRPIVRHLGDKPCRSEIEGQRNKTTQLVGQAGIISA